MRHLIRTDDFSTERIMQVLKDAEHYLAGQFDPILKNKIIITLFFENSTRTKSSFEIAAKRLGAEVVHLDVRKSSTKKGESLVDTAMNLDAMPARLSPEKLPQVMRSVFTLLVKRPLSSP